MPYTKKTIGILGGMGPVASAHLYHRIIKVAQTKYQAAQDQDFPPMVIYNLPLLGFDERGLAAPDLVKEQLIAGVRKLEQAGSECIVIPCMTVHYFYHDMQKAVRIPILHMVEEIVKRVQAARITKVGLLTSESSQRLRLYESALHAHGIQALHVSQTQQQALNEIIFQVMKGVQGPLDTACLKSVIADLCAQGAESIIIGCTELPLAITQKDVAVPLLDSLQIMAEVSLSHSLKN